MTNLNGTEHNLNGHKVIAGRVQDDGTNKGPEGQTDGLT